MADLIHTQTVKQFSPLNRLLNEYARKKADKWQNLIQLGSLFTNPIDKATQAAIYPIFRLINPFITIGINLKNKDLKKAYWSTVLLPVKEVIAMIAIFNFEGRQGIRLAWSLVGANTLINVAKGKKQRDSFFWRRLFVVRLAEENSNHREKFNLTDKRVYLLSLSRPSQNLPLEEIGAKEAFNKYHENSYIRPYFSALRILTVAVCVPWIERKWGKGIRLFTGTKKNNSRIDY